MKFHRFSVGLAAAAMTLSLSSAWAQDERGRPRESEPASRPSSGETVGSAVPRGGAGESATPSSGATSSSPANNGSASNPASSPSSWMDPGSSRGFGPRAPVRPERADRWEARDQRSRPAGAESSGSAVPRGESGGGGRSSGSTGSTSASSGSASSGSDNQPAQGHSRAVPSNSRPRGDKNQTGSAVERTSPPYTGGGYYPSYPYYPGYGYGYGYVYDPFYSYYYSPYNRGYGYWNPWGYGYGLGYFSYDPYLFGGIGDPGYYGGSGGSSGGGSYVQHYQGAGSLRLKIKPADAQVYIDGYYVGVVDSFDGAFQKLNVDAGPHRVELKAEGYETSEFDVVVTPGDTITYKGDMKRK